MCCLFGFVDDQNHLTAKQKSQLISALATAAEVRGTDATGIAYNTGKRLHIYKRPWAGHFMRFPVPQEARAVMRHARFTTQGTAKRNYNNHPFYGKAGDLSFALAHNGVLQNDVILQKDLPKTRIETDSYVAVQLIEQSKILNMDSLKKMAEQVRGSFTFTILDQHNHLHIVKGTSPLCIDFFPMHNLYIYCSTEEILLDALSHLNKSFGKVKSISCKEGDILQFQPNGTVLLDKFHLPIFPNLNPWNRPRWSHSFGSNYDDNDDYDWENEDFCSSHLEALKSIAPSLGYTPKAIEILFQQGYTPEEIEEILYGVRP